MTLQAKAFDRAGNRVESDPVGVVVNDTTPPSVAIVVPEPGFVRAIVPLLASVTDAAVITRVAFLVNGAEVAEDRFRLPDPFGVPGLYNGVVLARVNTKIEMAEIEIGLRDMLNNSENAYWDKYFTY